MKIEVEISQEDHDCMLAQLRKKNVGTDEKPVLEDDLTVQWWLQGAIDGKVNNCKKRAHAALFKG